MLALVVLAALAGAAGQVVRVIAGLAKEKERRAAEESASVAASAAAAAASAVGAAGKPPFSGRSQGDRPQGGRAQPKKGASSLQSKEVFYNLGIAAASGAGAGVVGVLTGAYDPHQLKNDTLFVISLAGYAGTDFIEAFVAKA